MTWAALACVLTLILPAGGVRVALNYGGISLVNYYYIYYVLLYVYDSEFLFFYYGEI